MKHLFVYSILLFSITTIAQKPMDSIMAGDFKMLAKFFPGSDRGPYHSAYQLEPAGFIGRLDSFRRYASKVVYPGQLRKKDIDAFSKMVLAVYKQNYGVDSAKTAEYYQLLFRDEKPDSLEQRRLEQLDRERLVKKLSARDSMMLDSLIFANLDLEDSALFKASYAYRQMVTMKLNDIQSRQYADTTKDQSISRQHMLDEVLKKGYIYEYFSHENIDFLLNTDKDSATIGEGYRMYMARARNKAFRDGIVTAYKNYRALMKDAPAPDFVYRDIDGKSVSLRQLRGKYVYIDVWATWCGPCKMEIPHLAKLEEAYAGKNIHFVSLSVDKQKDKGAWEKYVRTHQLKGIQLMADKDFQSDFIKKFNITYIPRFILIDPEGRIVQANASRPSDPGLRSRLDGLL